ncbi:GtrA family protein [Streptomyces sp. NPDC001443]
MMTSPLASNPVTTRTARRTQRAKAAAWNNAGRPGAPSGRLSSFIRFMVCGGGVGLASSPAVTLLAIHMPWMMANALITAASTVLCTELHARFTFGTGQRAGWRQHWQSAGSATAAYAVTSAAMLLLHATLASPGALWEQSVYLGASALAGIGRFIVLRLFVFANGKRSSSPTSAPETTRPKTALRLGGTKVSTPVSSPSAEVPISRGARDHGVDPLTTPTRRFRRDSSSLSGSGCRHASISRQRNANGIAWLATPLRWLTPVATVG